MVADNKNSVPGDKKAEPFVTAGGQTNRPHFSFRSINKRKTAAVFLIIIALIGVLLLVSGKWHVGEKVYAQVAGHKIYKKDVQTLIGDNKGISNRQAATVLADKYLVEAMAKEQGVTITNQDIETAYGSEINKQKTSDQYAYQNKVNQVYFAKLSAYNTGLYKGQLLVANFSRNIPYQSPLLEQKKAANPNIGNSAAIAADKKYAQNLINNLYQQIEEGKITFEQAARIERDDPEVGEKAYPTLPHSGPFDTLSKSRINGLIQTASVRQKVNDIKPSQTSKPFVVSVSNSINDDSVVESYYLVIKMDTSAGGNSNMNFDQEVTQAKQQLGYKVYV